MKLSAIERSTTASRRSSRGSVGSTDFRSTGRRRSSIGSDMERTTSDQSSMTSRRSATKDTVTSAVDMKKITQHSGKLFWACVAGDLEAATQMLHAATSRLGASPVKALKDGSGYSLLHFACASGSLPLVRLLCGPPHCADACFCADDGKSPIMVAAAHGHLDIVQYLCTTHGALSAPGAPSSWAIWSMLLTEGQALPALQPRVNGSPSSSTATPKPPSVEKLAAVRDFIAKQVGGSDMPEGERRRSVRFKVNGDDFPSDASTRSQSVESLRPDASLRERR
eukprot:CAMPEP_0176127856 /NCGR_PEP_ID=MMETSP0120_2-20121206/64588_1 /TAXON_ID=160619 /ORGANISM="Kryptoperidinium foliaceum, Strain CCMP 1326" /LENGTH=280 /DNA_ID=CAMNT_0017462909 /DNA_START=114 /DNA_END=953 /DNA_ORIENTATION=+